jgi:hypothetical protein
MKIMLSVNSAADTRPDYAVIDLTPALARDIIAKNELVRQINLKDDSVMHVEFYNVPANYFELCDESEKVIADNDELSDGIWIAEELIIPEDDFYRTECERLVIYANANPGVGGPTILYKAAAKYSDVEFCTAYIPLPLIEQIAKEHNEKAMDLPKV